jgi:hypothetical protein
MDFPIVEEFIECCINNDVKKVDELYHKNSEIIDIKNIRYDTKTSDVQGPYSLFECMCIKNNIEMVKWFIEQKLEYEHLNDGFISACQYNNLGIAEYIYNNNHDKYKLELQVAFLICSHCGNLDILKWLLITSKNSENPNDKIDLHYNNESPFIYAVSELKLEVMKWLYYISIMDEKLIDIHIDNNFAFIYSCQYGRLDICKWLYLISENKINKKLYLEYANINVEIINQELIEWLNN